MLSNFLVPPAPSPWHQLILIKNLLMPIAMFAVYACLVKLFEHRAAHELNIRTGIYTVLPGALIGSAVIACFVLVLWLAKAADISSGTGPAGLLTELLVPFVTALGEELLFRVILFRLIEEMTGTSIAIVVSAALFGLAHLANPGATAMTITALSIDMGVLLALAFVLTRNIWFAAGIHMSWNFTEGFIFGLRDSGVRDPYSLLNSTLSGSDLVSGGDFGPEGSIVLVILSLIVSAALWTAIKRKNRWEPTRIRYRR